MGYDLHVTRGTNWIENEGHEIREAEWLATVEADPELRFAEPGDDTYADGLVLWLEQSSGGDQPWFIWVQGNVDTKNPGPATIQKMLDLAERLNARVQGDDCEAYLSDGRVQQDDGEFLEGVDWRTPD